MDKRLLQDEILRSLKASDRKLQLYELRDRLPVFQDLPDAEWHAVIQDLHADGMIEAGLLRTGAYGDVRAAYNLEITPRGRALTPEGCQPTVGPGCQGSPSGPPSGAFNREDRKFAQLAIEEARKSASEADGRSHPKVGAVVVRGNQVIAQAHRGEEPGCHAEYIVLERKLADDSLVDATVYTTLEPCTARNHPKVPCARRIAERKVKRVVIGTLDPNPSITGRGQLMLREANIITDLFPHDLMSQVEELNRDFTRQYRTAAADAPIITAGWEVRYPGGLADVSMLRTKEPALVQRFAIGEDFTLINRSPHPVSISALFLIVYGCTQLAVDPFSLQLPEWPRLLAAFGIRQKPQLLFPLNLAGHSAIEGHILVPIRPDGQGRGVGGDVPAKRQYLFEFEELLTGKKSSVVVSAIGAPDRDNHQCYSGTDLARPGPKQQPFSVD